jgi:AbrB family looped-hinge helix DNA binding protein
MKRKIRSIMVSSEMEAVIRKRNQITLPSEAVELLQLHEGDTVVVKVQNGTAILRPVRQSYAGIAKGFYGAGFVERERSDWE